MHVLRKNGWYKKVRNYFLIIGSTSYFDDYLSKIDVEKDSFIELVRQDDTQRKGGVITWDPSPNLVVRNSDYHGLVASAHDRLGELIKEFTTEDAYIYIHNIATKYQQQFKCVSVGTDCVAAQVSLCRQILCKILRQK